MREILFRGKRSDTGEWIYGDVQQNVDAVKIREQEQSMQRVARSFVVISETVGQYTELTDKNGRKIFEGDICEFTDTDGEKTLYTVIWDYHRWIVVQMYDGNDVDPDDLDEAFTEYAEVIGNIHDNPELLEVSKE